MSVQSAATSGKPTVVDVFSGCGGSSLGYKWAGYRELLAVEWDKNAIDTFRLNFPEINIFAGDICRLGGGRALEITGLKPGELDVFNGSPPCQAFSKMGNTNLKDSRGKLFTEYIRLLNVFKPKVFVAENVVGLITGKFKTFYLDIMSQLRESGYNVEAQVMECKYFEVPQMRERVIIIGVRSDLNLLPSHPRPYAKPITFKDAIANLVIPPDEPPYHPTDQELERWHILKPGENQALTKYGWMRAAHVKLRWDQVAPTLVTSHGCLPFHPSEPRRLLVCEIARLATFPDNFKFIGTRFERIARIGNSVPPKLMYAIAKHIKENILNSDPTAIRSGDPINARFS